MMRPTARGKATEACAGFHHAALDRRHLLQAGALGAIGLSMPGLLAAREMATSPRSAGFGQARRCILLFMWGGPSQLDTWDPKPEAPAEVRGEFKPIDTNVPGIQISEHFPLLAKQADKYAIVRSVGHNDPAHLSSVHHLTTGRLAPRPMSDADPPSRDDWPHIGSMLGRLRPSSGTLPSAITIPWIVSHPAAPGGKAPGQHAGMLGPGYDPFVIEGDPNAANFQVSGLSLPAGVTASQMHGRRELAKLFDHQAERLSQDSVAASFDKHQQRAVDLVASPQARSALDLSQETAATRDRYGRNIHGQSVLLARRLAEAEVPLVTVNWHNDGSNFWDTHGNNFNRHKNDLMPPADRAFAALLEDLAERSMLTETLVVWVGEFGRTPRISQNNAGREHWPWCYSAVFAGGGIAGGRVYGRSDRMGGYPAANPVAPADLTATMYHALGVPHDLPIQDRQGRPVSLTSGHPVGLFA
jgi:hypothetical protein